jgi:hypothetical protein
MGVGVLARNRFVLIDTVILHDDVLNDFKVLVS